MGAPIVTDAILLRSVAYGEADKVVTLLGRSTGRISALARGARKSLRRFGGGLGLGSCGEAELRERSGAELFSLEGFSVKRGRSGLAGNVAGMAHAAYGIELCDRLCAIRHPEPEVFDWLDGFVTALEERQPSVERLRIFELGLMKRLGIAPAFGACVGCGRMDLEDESTTWRPDRGGVLCPRCTHLGVGVGVVLGGPARQALARMSQLSITDAEGLQLGTEINAGCRKVLRDFFEHHLTNPLKSLEFIEKMSGGHS